MTTTQAESVGPMLGWVFTLTLLALAITSRLAQRGRIRRNHLIGIRIPSTLHDDAAWRAGHGAAVVPSGVAFVVALACDLIGLAVSGAVIGALVAFGAGLVWSLAAAGSAARKTAS